MESRRISDAIIYVVACLAAIAIRYALQPVVGDNYPYFPVFFVALFAAFRSGFWACTLISAFGWTAGNALFLRPFGYPFPVESTNILGSLFFWINAIALAALGEANQRHKKQVLTSEQRYRALFESVTDGITLTRGDRYIEVNPAFCLMTGYDRRELIGKETSITMSGEGLAERAAAIQEVLATGSTHVILPLLKKDGTVIQVEASSIQAANGDRWSVISDVTDRMRAQEQASRHREELKLQVAERTADLETFVYSVAHDLRQHIRGVATNAGLAKEEEGDSLTPLARKHLDKVSECARRMADMTAAILKHARSGIRAIDGEELDITALAEECVIDLRSQAKHNPATEFTIQPDLRALGDTELVRVVLMNLLDNAAKYSAQELLPTVAFGQDEQSFFVRDNGIGFDMKYLDRIFKPFERLASDYDGAGVGLGTTKRIIERHGGSLWAEAELGKGATFRFTLPSSRASDGEPERKPRGERVGGQS